jgi:hypothetical protein
MYYECSDCNRLATFAQRHEPTFATRCPVCEEVTHWTLAFADEEASP